MDITFRPLAEADIPNLHRWLNNPLVAEWYGLGLKNDKLPTLQQVHDKHMATITGKQPTRAWIIVRDGEDVGYIQCYRIGHHPEYARTLEDYDDAIGIDIFIGEDNARGGGTGAAAIRAFVETEVFTRPGVTTAVIAPEPANARAIRCYENAGFTHEKTVFIPESGEHEYVMVQRRPLSGVRLLA